MLRQVRVVFDCRETVSFGSADELDFEVGFSDAQPVQQPREPMIIMERITRLTLPDESRLPGFNHDIGAFMLV